MNKLGVEDLVHERVKLAVTDSPDGVSIHISGIIDMEEPGMVLDPFFEKVNTEAVARKVGTVHFDVHELSFLNSSGIKSLAKWVIKASQAPASAKYKINIIQNKAITWQRTSLVTLTFAAPGVVSLS